MMRRKKLKTDIVTAFLTLLLVGFTVTAWFISSVGATDATYVAGTVDIEAGRVLDVNGGIPMDEDNWNPGDENLVAYRVDNVGSMAADLWVELGSHWESGLPDDNVIIKVAGSNKNRWVQDLSNPTIYRYDRPFTGSAELYLSVKLLGQETGNEYQGQTFILSQTFYAAAETPPPPPPSEQYGALYVTKTVEGENAPQESFDVTVQFSGDALGTIRHEGENSPDGIYALSLSAGEWATFTNITPGTTYTVSEALTEAQDNSGWRAPVDISGDISAADETDTVTVHNIYNAGVLGITDENTDDDGDAEIDVILPRTGGIAVSTILAIIGTIMTAAGAAAYLTLRRRRLSGC